MPGVQTLRDTRDATAFAALYRRHYAAVLGYAVRRIADREAAREIAGDEIVALRGAETLAGCRWSVEQHDQAVATYFTGVLHYRIDGDRVTFTKGDDTAVFERG